MSVQKVPQTSVAPTYKLTLPSEFVVANLSHLIDQTFDLTDREGSDSWKVALLPRRWAPHYLPPEVEMPDARPLTCLSAPHVHVSLPALYAKANRCKRSLPKQQTFQALLELPRSWHCMQNIHASAKPYASVCMIMAYD